MYRLSDVENGFYDDCISDADNGVYDDSISRGEVVTYKDYFASALARGVFGTGPINKHEFSILDAINISLLPKPGGHCWICPLGPPLTIQTE